jgi:hypothetical protein
MSIQAINSVTMFDPINNAGIDNSGLQTAAGSGSGNMGVIPSGTTGGTVTDVVQLSTATNGTSNSNSDIYYDVRDANKDGIVSAQEEYQYALTHPGEETKSQVANATSNLQAVTQYNQQGSVWVSTNMIPGLINISV